MPIRIRLTLAFTLAMAAVLAGVGLFVYHGLSSAMDDSIHDDLLGRADLVKNYVLQAGGTLSQEAKIEALSELLAGLLVGCPIALILAAVLA